MADGIKNPLKSLSAIKWSRTADFWMRRRVSAFKCGALVRGGLGMGGGGLKKKGVKTANTIRGYVVATISRRIVIVLGVKR